MSVTFFTSYYVLFISFEMDKRMNKKNIRIQSAATKDEEDKIECMNYE